MYSSEPLMHEDLPDSRTAKVFGAMDDLLDLDNIETTVGDFRNFDFGVSGGCTLDHDKVAVLSSANGPWHTAAVGPQKRPIDSCESCQKFRVSYVPCLG